MVAKQIGPGPDMYTIKMNPVGPSYNFGSRFDEKRKPPGKPDADGRRFDSSLRQKPHLKPKKVDGPGPGDYALASSIKKNTRSFASMQDSTWGTGRNPDWNPNKRKQEMIMPGPSHYNHVYNDANFNRIPNDGYRFPTALREIQKHRD